MHFVSGIVNRYNNINNDNMKTKEEILKKNCPSMDILFLDQQGREFRSRIFDAMKEYAEECIKASLDKASKEAKIYKESCGISSECGCMGNCNYPISYINKKSITNPENIVLL